MLNEFLKICFLFIFGLSFFPSYAQVPADSAFVKETQKDGEIKIITPPSFAILLDKYRQSNYNSPGFEGYRLQIFIDSGNNAKERASSVLNEFQQNYPDLPAYLIYQQPNFKVRVGNFKTGAEARKIQLDLRNAFPSSFIVKDIINIIQ